MGSPTGFGQSKYGGSCLLTFSNHLFFPIFVRLRSTFADTRFPPGRRRRRRSTKLNTGQRPITGVFRNPILCCKRRSSEATCGLEDHRCIRRHSRTGRIFHSQSQSSWKRLTPTATDTHFMRSKAGVASPMPKMRKRATPASSCHAGSEPMQYAGTRTPDLLRVGISSASPSRRRRSSSREGHRHYSTDQCLRGRSMSQDQVSH